MEYLIVTQMKGDDGAVDKILVEIAPDIGRLKTVDLVGFQGDEAKLLRSQLEGAGLLVKEWPTQTVFQGARHRPLKAGIIISAMRPSALVAVMFGVGLYYNDMYSDVLRFQGDGRCGSLTEFGKILSRAIRVYRLKGPFADLANAYTQFFSQMVDRRGENGAESWRNYLDEIREQEELISKSADELSAKEVSPGVLFMQTREVHLDWAFIARELSGWPGCVLYAIEVSDDTDSEVYLGIVAGRGDHLRPQVERLFIKEDTGEEHGFGFSLASEAWPEALAQLSQTVTEEVPVKA